MCAVSQCCEWFAVAAALALSTVARADDEIQVYTGEIVDVGKWSAQHHLNYAIQGRKVPDFPGGLIPNHTLNGTGEYAYGVADWFEFGFYTPYAFDKEGFHSNAGKLRTLFVTPDAGKREFFYGLNIEYQYLMPKFSDTRFGMEIRPIIGWRKGEYEFIVNPIIDVSFGNNGEVVFAPNARLARNFGDDLAFAIEYYTDLGPLAHFLPFKEQGHNIYAVVDFKIGRFDIDFGIGYGLTKPGSDRWMTKMIISTDLYDKAKDGDAKAQATNKSKMPVKARPALTPIEPAYDYAGCFVGGYAGGSWTADLEATDPLSTGGAFYNAPFANAANGGDYRIPLKFSGNGGGAAGCNWHAPRSRFVWGAEAEAGYMRLTANAINPYSLPFNGDTLDTTTIGNWFGALSGRAGWATDRALFYAKGGVGFTEVKSTVTDNCSGGLCGASLLNASSSNTRAFFVGGGGIEWAWTGNWTVKTEYLYLGLNETYSVCGPGGGGVAGSTFCSGHSLSGVHTGKIGLNYKIL
jgi:opacity protein-like surface antigen